MTNTETASRYFGRCRATGCKHRVVADDVSGRFDFNGHRCSEHGAYPLNWDSLKGKLNLKKECGARCLASTGPSCSCSCGGELHGAAHL